jgi:peroxiredoxin (alkyl hydroperoxide reductase subunit C)
MPLQVASPAPKFKAQAYVSSTNLVRDAALEDYKGLWLCLYFYPSDFTAVCPTELVEFDRNLDQFKDRDCELVACSSNSIQVHKAWCDAVKELRTLRHPLLADPTHRLAMDYGVLLADKGLPLRATFLIDPQANLRWMAVYDLSVGRSVPEVLRVLDALQTNQPCPCNWKKGDPTLAL